MRRALVVPVIAGLLGLGQLSPAPVAAMTVDQRYAMPSEGTVTFRGHGYGHGHGMSQYGAEGAARRGLTWQQITSFYYPGTALGRFGRKVRVLLSHDTSRDVVVSSRSGLQAVDTATGERFLLPQNGARRWRLQVVDGRTVVQYRADRWRDWRDLSGDGAFYAGGHPLTLWVAGVGRAYRGMLVAASPVAGSTDRDTVNVLAMDNYLRGVVPAEMPATWSPQAVRAQAVAARTYAAYERAHPRASHYDFCDTTSCQVYGGYDREHPASNAAIDATAGTILTYDGEPAFTQFSSSSGGWTSANQFPYLPAQEDPYDDWAGNPVHDWTLTVDVRRIEATWPAIGNLRSIRFVERDGNGEWGGRAWSIVLVGAKASRTVSGHDFRGRLGLRSTWFTVASVKAA